MFSERQAEQTCNFPEHSQELCKDTNNNPLQHRRARWMMMRSCLTGPSPPSKSRTKRLRRERRVLSVFCVRHGSDHYDAKYLFGYHPNRLNPDLDLFFGRKTSNSDINTLTDVQAVKRSVRNLVQLDYFEKPFHPEIASGIRGMLFELMTPFTAQVIARQIEDVINNFEPRAKLVGVTAIPDLDRNAYEVKVEFYVVNTPTELVDLTVFLERLR